VLFWSEISTIIQAMNGVKPINTALGSQVGSSSVNPVTSWSTPIAAAPTATATDT
jgi:hypothetical protein